MELKDWLENHHIHHKTSCNSEYKCFTRFNTGEFATDCGDEECPSRHEITCYCVEIY